MASPSVVEIDVTRESDDGLAPRLETAPDLLYNLGFCLAVSSTRDVARVILPADAPGGPTLSTNLIRIANEGSNAFLGAYKDLLGISNSSEELCQNGGLLDQLGGLLLHGGTKSSKNLVYSWVQDCVSSCSAAGERTAGNFDSWRSTVHKVMEAVDGAKNTNVANVAMTERARRATEGKLKENSVEISMAVDEIIFAVQRQEDKSKVYKQMAGEHEGLLSEQLEEYLYNPFWAAIKRPFKAAAGNKALNETAKLRAQAERDLHEAFRELNERRKTEMSFKLRAERLSLQIDEYLNEEAKLEEIITIISQVCELLGDLASDVSALLHTFAKLSEEIKRLVDIRKRIEKPAGINLGFTRVNPFGKKAKFVEANKKDEAYMTRLFFQQVMRMKQVCLGIHVLSKLYAGIINDVINYGFAEALRASYDDLGQTSTAMIVAGRKKRMKKWHDQAKLVCSERNREAARSFQDQLRAMGNGSMDQMPQFERTVGTVPWLGTPSPFGSATPAGMGLGADFMATFPTPGLSVPEYPPGTARRAFSPQRPLSPQPAIDPRIYISPPASVRRRDSFDS